MVSQESYVYDLVRRFPLSLRERLMISQKSQSYNLQFRKKEALLFLSLFSFFCYFETGSHYMVQAGLKLNVPPECQDYRYEPFFAGSFVVQS